MLIRFVVDNFLSFGQRTELLMAPAENVEGHEHHVRDHFGKVKTLRTAAIFGANANGKSNLVKALGYFVELIRAGKITGPTEGRKFRLDPANRDKPIKFEIEFIKGNFSYWYGVELHRNRIVGEGLYFTSLKESDHSDELLFNREWDGAEEKLEFRKNRPGTISEKLELYDNLIHTKFLQSDRLLLELLLETDAEGYDNHLLSTLKFLRNNVWVVLPDSRPRHLVNWLKTKPRVGKTGTELLQASDLGVEDILFRETLLKNYDGFSAQQKEDEIEPRLLEEPQGFSLSSDNGLEVFIGPGESGPIVSELVVKHKGLPQESLNEDFLFDLEDESDGTNRIVDFIPIIYGLTNSDVCIVVDEIGRSLHPLLIHQLIKQISLSRDIKGQLIFTTHEDVLMSLKLLRQDEYWLVEKDAFGCSELFSLGDFKDLGVSKIRDGYFQGRYQGIPRVEEIKKIINNIPNA